MSLAAGSLLALVFGLVVHDWLVHKGKNRRALWLETAVFVGGAMSSRRWRWAHGP